MTGAVERAKKSQKRSKAEQKAEAMEILNAKVRGERDVDIAARLHLHPRTVQRRLEKFIEENGQASVEAYRQVTEQQIDAVISQGMWAMARAAEEKQLDDKAAKLVLDAIDRKVKLLGIAAPDQSEVTVTVQSEQEKQLHALLDQAARQERMREHNLREAAMQAEQAEA